MDMSVTNVTTEFAELSSAANYSMDIAELNTTTLPSLGVNGTFRVHHGTSRHLGTTTQVLISISYIAGIVGNIAALAILCLGKRYRNRKHTTMLRFLASNDLVALVGMLVQMYIQLHFPVERSHLFCVFRVIWRFFGLSSGCVAIVMAMERWLALTRPFLYQKHVTHTTIMRAIFFLWLAALVLVCQPFLGFGLYYQESRCTRYKLAKTLTDKAYAYLFFTLGSLMVVCIVACNVAVIRVLCHMGCRRRGVVGRRHSSRNRAPLGGEPVTDNKVVSTYEELAFAKLMAILCVVFVICWEPQMISILLTQFLPQWKGGKMFSRLADILLSLHFTLNPYIYVLLRCQKQPCLPNFFKLMCGLCRRDHQPLTNSQPGSLAMTEHEPLESGEVHSANAMRASV